jgi:phosphate-induced protein 1
LAEPYQYSISKENPMKHLKKPCLQIFVALIPVLCVFWSVQAQELDTTPEGRSGGKASHRPNTPEGRGRPDARPGKNNNGNGLIYHGGPVIQGVTQVYYIWYGNWSGNTAMTILPDFAENIGGSQYFNINTTYFNGSNVHVMNAVQYATSTTDNYSRGVRLGDADIQGIVSDAITQGRLPLDTNGVYFVLTSADVRETSGFCTQYCGWHTHTTVGGLDIKYAFIGNPDRCPSSCMPQARGPNGNAGADGMVNIIAHELEEAVTDPDLNAWYDGRGEENADKCIWTFGTTYVTPNGARANMKLGNRDFLIQQNWVNANGGFCALSLP